jgi:hypothetical protein
LVFDKLKLNEKKEKDLIVNNVEKKKDVKINEKKEKKDLIVNNVEIKKRFKSPLIKTNK